MHVTRRLPSGGGLNLGLGLGGLGWLVEKSLVLLLGLDESLLEEVGVCVVLA